MLVHIPIESNEELMSTPNAKRSRGQFDASEAPWKGAITALSTCVSREDCIDALSSSFRIFNHSNQQVHDEEVSSGADAVSCRLLSFLLLKETFNDEQVAAKETFNEEQAAAAQASSASAAGEGHAPASTPSTDNKRAIACTLQITEMIYRCSKKVIESSFRKVGPDFLNLVANVLALHLPQYQASPEDQEMQSAEAIPPDVTKSANVSVRSVSKILCHFARVQSATTSMARHPRLLSLMLSLIQRPLGTIPFEAHHNLLWVLANMACSTENMQHMMSHGSLLDMIIQSTSVIHDIDEARRPQVLRLQHSAFRCLLNLSWDEANKIVMSERDDLVNIIKRTVETKGAVPDDTSNTIGTVLLQTRMFALGTLRNVAHSPPPQQLRLCTLEDGMLLNLLCDTARGDEEPTVKDKAFAVIYNLVSAETAELLVSHPRLLDALVEAASVPGDSEGANAAEGSRAMSFRALNAIEQALSPSCPEECCMRMRRATEQVSTARRFQDVAISDEENA